MAFAGIVLGVSLLILVLSVMNGFDKEVREKILTMVPQGSIHGYQYFGDWPAVANQIAEHPEVIATAPFIHLQGMLVNGDKVGGVFVHSIDPESEQNVSDIDAYISDFRLRDLGVVNGVVNGVVDVDGVVNGNVTGNVTGNGDLTRARMIIGKQVSKRLNLAVGDVATLLVPQPGSSGRTSPRLKSFTIAGIIESGTEIDRNLAIILLSDAQQILQLQDHQVQGIRIKVQDIFSAPRVVGEVRSMLPYGFYARNWTESHGNLYQAVSMSKRLVSLLLFVIIGVAAFNVVACLVIIVRDKQGDIAILRTMGMTAGRIRMVFVFLGGTIGVSGTLVGAVLGLVLSLSISDLVLLLESLIGVQFLHSDVYPITYLPSDIRAGDVLYICAVTVFLTLLATLYPASRAGKIAPAEVLRDC
jgi:lipoprotein-releasing system permease protein